jgi:hypothetical protein
MKFRKVFLLTLLFFLSSLTFAQVMYDYGFEKKFNITVTDSLGSTLQMPWVGGMNSMQFSEIDLNLDGTMDLFAFDKATNKVLTFINKGISDSICYVYDYSYQKHFPTFYGWAHLLDYNQDGKNDIFAYTTLGGIMVYKNISDTAIKFQLLYPLVNSDMGMSTSNIFVTSDDYPALYDIDHDGDIDVLSFFGLGTFVQMNKNLSQELYGNSDTLIFELTRQCWGDIAESAANNHISLDITCPNRCADYPPSKASRHTGSTMLAGEFNGDTLTDLILGDVDYFNLTKLTNGGTVDSAHIAASDTLFPSNSLPIHFNSFPVVNLVDVNNDGLKDMIASPFTSNINIPENNKSVWLYKNTGDSLVPVFTFVEPDFLQKDMIDLGSGTYPVIYDVNSDGLPDIMAGNFGYLDSSYYEFGFLKSKIRSQIAVLQNTGTLTNPSFHLVIRDYAHLSQLKLTGLVPTFGDLDNDGDMDMICGQSNGSLMYFENTAGAGNPPLYSPPVYNYKGIDVGDYSAPQLFDLNSDNLLDLVVGKKSGYLTYYQNTGTVANAAFTKITDTLGKVCVIDPTISYAGYSTPCFFKDSGEIKLFVGSEKGYIFYYKDIVANLTGKFTASDSVLIFVDQDSATMFINDGSRAGVAAADLDNDGYMDMLVGNFAGGLCYYKGMKPKPFDGIAQAIPDEPVNFSIYPNPVSGKLYIKVSDNDRLHFKAEIFDLIGRKIIEKDFNNTLVAEIDMQAYRAGFYMCSLLTIDKQGKAHQAGTRKFVITR